MGRLKFDFHRFGDDEDAFSAIFLDVFTRHRGPRYGALSFGQVAAFIARHVGVNEQQAVWKSNFMARSC